MTLALHFPQCHGCGLGRIDPRWRLAGLTACLIAVLLLHRPWPSLSAFLGACLLTASIRVPWGWLFGRLGFVWLFLLLFAAWLPFENRPPFVEWGGLSLSQSGLERAAVLLLRTGALVSLAICLLAAGRIEDTLRAAHALHVPGVLVQLTLLTYRYLFLLAEEFDRLRTALRVRGFRNRANGHSYRTIGQVAGTLLIRGHERAERVGQAMRCRGFAGEFHTLRQFETRGIDVAAFVALVVGAGAILAWDRFL